MFAICRPFDSVYMSICNAVRAIGARDVYKLSGSFLVPYCTTLTLCDK